MTCGTPAARAEERAHRERLAHADGSVRRHERAHEPASPERRRHIGHAARAWRPWVLASVYLLGALHWLHWRWAGTTIAPAELNESQYTLEHSVLTVGFILMAVAVIATMIFGRFFCGWGCHVLGLQDSAGWLLRRVGFTPKPVRMRVAQWVPLFAMGTMFVWPQLERWWSDAPVAALHVTTDAEGLGSLVTSDLARNLPGPWMSLTTFLVCAGVVTWLLGTRSFCTYVCPYGAVFSLADRASPVRVRLKVLDEAGGVGTNDCVSCGVCTAACPSHIRVHEEVAEFGRVVNPACLRDYHCIAACPKERLVLGVAKPGGMLSWRQRGRFGVAYDLSAGEEAIALVVMASSVAVLRGLYDAVPFFLALAVAVVLAYTTVVAVRLDQGRSVAFAGWPLRLSERTTQAGRWFTALFLLTSVVWLHSAVVRVQSWLGGAAFERAIVSGDPNVAASAERHLAWVERWGIICPDSIDRQLAVLAITRGDAYAARPRVVRVLARSPDDELWRQTLERLDREPSGLTH